MIKQTKIFYNEMTKDNLKRLQEYKKVLIKDLLDNIFNNDDVIKDLNQLVLTEEQIKTNIEKNENDIEIAETEENING